MFGAGETGGEEGDGGDEASLVGLEVPVHDAVVVDVLQGQHRLSEVHTGHLHGQRPDVLQQGGAVAPWGGPERRDAG